MRRQSRAAAARPESRASADPPPPVEAAAPHGPTGRPADARGRRRRGPIGRLVLAALIAAAAVVAIAVVGFGWKRSEAIRAWRRVAGSVSLEKAGPPAEPPAPPLPSVSDDGAIRIAPEQAERLGLTFATVAAQTDSMPLEVTGSTAYDPSTLSRVRSRFSCVVKRVFVAIGQSVKKGDPLVELFSTELAEAKGLYETRLAQWEHDSAQLRREKPLYESNALSEKDYLDTVNDERKSRLEYKVARDNLIVYGLSEDEIKALPTEEGTRKPLMTLRAPTDGLVISRDVVEGSLYDEKTVLLTIARLDHLWVLGNVYESDLDKVQVGLRWDVRFPFLEQTITTQVEQVDPRVDPDTKTVQIRTTIANPEGHFKADMLVHGTLRIPPKPGLRVLPRVAVVVGDGAAWVFVREPHDPHRFRRREVQIVKELHDRTIVSSGVEPGEQVVCRGSLIVSQIDEDLRMVQPSPSE
jgi:cobalt-zinc-cadmium efflux system membrane fusion protein